MNKQVIELLRLRPSDAQVGFSFMQCGEIYEFPVLTTDDRNVYVCDCDYEGNKLDANTVMFLGQEMSLTCHFKFSVVAILQDPKESTGEIYRNMNAAFERAYKKKS